MQFGQQVGAEVAFKVDRAEDSTENDELALGGRLLFRKAKVEEWIAGRETVVDFRSDWPAVQKWNVSDNATKGDVSWVLAQKN